ncbi:hypothetical protein ACFWM7_01410 [Streptomyces sp. NPDC058375]|uniref:hypothetical protein n=1 Tax=Streptomyces sp. NPDC058375 TaxID=3346467 RepID=UPI0036657339
MGEEATALRAAVDRAQRKIEAVEAAHDEAVRERNAAVADVKRLGEALKDVRADADYFQGWADGNGRRLNEALAEIERLNDEVAQLRSAWKVSTATRESYRRVTRDLNGVIRELLSASAERMHERDRYRLAWLSARRRAAEEANLGAEAVEHIAADRDRWQRGHERAEAQLHDGRRANAQLHQELAQVRAKLRDARAYAMERCSDDGANIASASWVLHLLGDD